MTEGQVILNGWKDICNALNIADIDVAKKLIKRYKIPFTEIKGQPVIVRDHLAHLFNRFPEDLEDLLKLIGLKNRHKFRQFIVAFKISSMNQILSIPKAEIARRGFGSTFILRLKQALLQKGIKYDEDDQITVEKKLRRQSIDRKSDNLLRLRFSIFERDNFRCQYCGRSPKSNSGVVIEIDHVHPQSKGGDWSPENLITSCRECNLGKGDLILDEISNRPEEGKSDLSTMQECSLTEGGDPDMAAKKR